MAPCSNGRSWSCSASSGTSIVVENGEIARGGYVLEHQLRDAGAHRQWSGHTLKGPWLPVRRM